MPQAVGMSLTAGRTAPPRRVAAAPSRAAVSPTAALWVIAAGTVAMLWLWWRDNSSVVGFGGWLIGAGRITGLLAGYAIIVLLALMARIPAIDRGIGTDRLARWHAMGGRYTISLAIAHTVLIIWGYAVLAHTGVVRETATMLTSYPDVLMATVGLGLLVLVGVVSARAARRRLEYETWHFVHFYVYLAVALAFSHEFATGSDFRDRTTRIAWSALYVAVAACLVWYRVVTPLRAARRNQLRVTRVVRESSDVVSVYLTGRHVAGLRAEPGQFFRWRFLTRDLWWAANPYSLSAVPVGDTLRITVKFSGKHSRSLKRVRPGTRVIAEGPYGSFTAARRRRRRVLLVAAGIGITPLRTLFESLPGEPPDVALVYRASTVEDLVLRGELDHIAARRGAAVHYVVGRRRRNGTDPLTVDRIVRLVPDVRSRDVYLCGPRGLVSRLTAELRRLGVPSASIHSEAFELEPIR
jgi:predicted ferric reductase